MPHRLSLQSELHDASAPTANGEAPLGFGAASMGNHAMWVQLTASCFSERYRLTVAIGPSLTDRHIGRLPRSKWEAALHEASHLRHVVAPRYLDALDEVITRRIDKQEPRHRPRAISPFANGRFAYLPPVHPYDLRLRAQRFVPRNPTVYLEWLPSWEPPFPDDGYHCAMLASELLSSYWRHPYLTDLPPLGERKMIDDLSRPWRPQRNTKYGRATPE